MSTLESQRTSRRQFMQGVAAGGAYALVPTLVRAEGNNTLQGERALIQLAQRPANYESVRSTFTTRVTPTDRFYIRSHFDAPEIEPQAYRLSIEGLVRKPVTFTLAELARMKQVSVEAVLQCAGNGRALFQPRVAGVQWGRGAVGNAVWRGVRLTDLLARVGVDPKASMLQLTGADVPTHNATPRFIRGLPLAKALHADTLLALTMNDLPLPRLHGGPARLVVPGWVADGWTKWVTEIKLLDAAPSGFFYETAYRYPVVPVEPGVAVPAEKLQPMSQLNVKSIIGSHDEGQVIAKGRQTIVGVAFAGDSGVRNVDITVDGGAIWLKARLDGKPSRYGFTRFTFEWDATPGLAHIASRAQDRLGALQPVTPAWNPSGYLYNAIDPIAVEVRA